MFENVIDLSQNAPKRLKFTYRRGIDYVKSVNLIKSGSVSSWKEAPYLLFKEGERINSILSKDGLTAVFTAPASFFSTVSNVDTVVLRDSTTIYAFGYFTVADDLRSFGGATFVGTDADTTVTINADNSININYIDKDLITMIGDQIAIDGKIIGPHLTGPAGGNSNSSNSGQTNSASLLIDAVIDDSSEVLYSGTPVLLTGFTADGVKKVKRFSFNSLPQTYEEYKERAESRALYQGVLSGDPLTSYNPGDKVTVALPGFEVEVKKEFVDNSSSSMILYPGYDTSVLTNDTGTFDPMPVAVVKNTIGDITTILTVSPSSFKSGESFDVSNSDPDINFYSNISANPFNSVTNLYVSKNSSSGSGSTFMPFVTYQYMDKSEGRANASVVYWMDSGTNELPDFAAMGDFCILSSGDFYVKTNYYWSKLN